MNAYLAIFKLRFALQLQYRAAALAALITNFFFGVVRVMVFQALYASTAGTLPFNLEQSVTYTWLTQVVFRLLPWTLDTEMLALVRSGGVAYELCRPLYLYFSWYCRLLAYRLVPALLTGLPIYIICVLLPGDFRALSPDSATAAVVWLVSMLIALLMSCALSNLINISTLWTIAGDGMQRLFPALVMILSGSIVPLAFFPDWSQTLLRLLPFSGLMDIPFRIYLGLVPGPEILVSLGLQILWTAFFVILGFKLLDRGVRKVVIQGG